MVEDFVPRKSLYRIFDRRSFRIKVIKPGVNLLVGCRKKHWSGGRCSEGMKAAQLRRRLGRKPKRRPTRLPARRARRKVANWPRRGRGRSGGRARNYLEPIWTGWRQQSGPHLEGDEWARAMQAARKLSRRTYQTYAVRRDPDGTITVEPWRDLPALVKREGRTIKVSGGRIVR